MFKRLLFISVFFFGFNLTAQVNQTSVELSRLLSKDIFELNGVPFMQPLVEAVNATSNSRFFNSAYIPKQDSFYIKISVNGMMGFVRDDMKNYNPSFPTEQFNATEILNRGYVSIGLAGGQPTANISDTANLVAYLFRTLLYDGIYGDGSIQVPNEAATILGSQNKQIVFGEGTLQRLAENRLDSLEALFSSFGISQGIPDSLRAEILGAVNGVPSLFSLPPGGNFSTLIAGVPQIEIGSFMGTELLLRFIPPVNMGEEIGKFSFYGLGLKHSISQYLPRADFDLAVQGVIQGTNLKNKVGVTNATLEANGRFMNFNIHGSKKFGEYFTLYSGFSYETINIDTRFTYALPIEIQYQLNLLDKGVDRDENGNLLEKSDPRYRPAQTEPTEGFPGDDKPQTAKLNLTAQNFKFVIGGNVEYEDFSLFMDYNISNFNIFTAGILYKINFH